MSTAWYNLIMICYRERLGNFWRSFLIALQRSYYLGDFLMEFEEYDEKVYIFYGYSLMFWYCVLV